MFWKGFLAARGPPEMKLNNRVRLVAPSEYVGAKEPHHQLLVAPCRVEESLGAYQAFLVAELIEERF